jgi:hypothetical protein
MTQIDAKTTATDFNDTATNAQLLDQGYSIRHIETWHRDNHSDSIIIWDTPAITEADLPY